MTQPLTSEASFWNEVFQEPDSPFGQEVSPFLASQAERFEAGHKVLSLGEGEGRNATWLAAKGCDVTCLDFSEVALEKTKALAKQRNVKVATLQGDVTQWAWPPATYDRLLWFFLHLPPAGQAILHQGIWHTLKPGGMLIGQLFHPDQLKYDSGGPPHLDWLYSVESLQQAFPEAEALLLENQTPVLNEGAYFQGKASVTNFVLKKPE